MRNFREANGLRPVERAFGPVERTRVLLNGPPTRHRQNGFGPLLMFRVNALLWRRTVARHPTRCHVRGC